MGALIVVILLGSVAALGRQGTQAANESSSQALLISDHPLPANSEPNGRAWGPADAPITVIEYADYECESCGYFAKNFEQVFSETFAPTGKVRFEIRNAPFHGEGARNAAEAAYCAAEQDAFWPYHNSLFANQPQQEGTGPQVFSKLRLTALAAQLGLNADSFGQCLSSGKYTAQVENDYNTAIQNNVNGTPTFVVNGQAYTGPKSTAEFRQIFAEVAPEVTFE